MREELRCLVADMVRGGLPLDVVKREIERLYVEEVLASVHGNQSAAARLLGIHRNTLSKKLESPQTGRRQATLAR